LSTVEGGIWAEDGAKLKNFMEGLLKVRKGLL
jgi:hypothetical protein